MMGRTLVHGLGSAWRRPPEDAPHHLVVFYKQLGDTVLLEPALAKLAADSGTEVLLHTKPALRFLIDLMPRVRALECPSRQACYDLWVYEPGSKASVQAWRVAARRKHLRLRKPLDLRSYHPWIFDDIAFASSNDTRAIRDTYTARLYWDATPGAQRESFRPPRLLDPPGSWCPDCGVPSGYILVNPAASLPYKSWPAEKWGAALNRIARETGAALLLAGAASGWALEHLDAIRSRLEVPFLDKVGRTSLREYLFLISRAELVLTVDGACSHLSQAFGRRTLTLFTEANTSNPANWSYPTAIARVLCERPHPTVAAFDGKPLEPEALLVQALELLALSPPNGAEAGEAAS